MISRGPASQLAACLLSVCLWFVQANALAGDGCPVDPDSPFPGWQVDSEPAQPDWYRLYLDCLPPLTHPRAGRWPLVFWQGVGDQPLEPEQIQALLSRGVVQHLPLDTAAIPAALALQAAGAPVIIMHARGAAWPYNLLDDQQWRLITEDPQRLPRLGRVQADPTRLDAWQRGAQQITEILEAFSDAGVKIDAVWLDYESQPLLLDLQTVRQAVHLAGRVPASALADEAAFAVYRRRLWLLLMSGHVAGTIESVYPHASTTNWVVTLSSSEAPVLSWDNWHHPQVLTRFSATTPIAYGVDSALLSLVKAYPPGDQAALDRLFLHILLRQVSADTWNRHQLAPQLDSVPWVARRVVDEDVPTPAMSRMAYREALRHLWLRDVDAMLVFNPVAGGRHWRRALAEAQDAQQVYAEMLVAGDLLAHGEVMNYQVPMPGEQGILWSGLRDEEKAIVRVVRLNGKQAGLYLQAWPGERVLLAATEAGTSYHLVRTAKGIRVEALR